MKLGRRFPEYSLIATVSTEPGSEFARIDQDGYPGLWKIYFFWPKDFTFVCPTELKAFSDMNEEVADRDAVLLGGSIDSEYVHLAWRRQHADLQQLQYPMLADVKRELGAALGILDDDSGVMQRATYLVDPDNIIRFSMITDMNVGRNPQEVLRVLDALQTDELCPCNWQPGQQTLSQQAEQREVSA